MVRHLAALGVLLASVSALAAPPVPYEATYLATYRGLQATASRSLAAVDDNLYQLESSVSLKLLGKTLTSIDEQSLVAMQDGDLLPTAYEYEQSGLGERRRKVVFDWDEQVAMINIDDTLLSLPLPGPVFDELSAQLEIKRQLEQGKREVVLRAVDKDRVEVERYRLLGRERLDTPLGSLDTVRLEKVRGPDSLRSTELWLAPDHDYLLVKLFQRDPDGRELELDLSNLRLGEAVAARSGR